MEITCPRCESTFAVDPRALRAHQGLVRCTVCQQVFRVELAALASGGEERSGWSWGRRLLLLVIFLLVLVLIAQVLWWTRSYAYAATSTPIRQALLNAAARFDVQIPWPGPNRDIRIVQSSVLPLPDHRAEIRGKIRNDAQLVQAYPVIQVTLSNSYGGTIARLEFRPSEYLGPERHAADGFVPGEDVSFHLSSPKLIAAPGYQVTLLSRP